MPEWGWNTKDFTLRHFSIVLLRMDMTWHRKLRNLLQKILLTIWPSKRNWVGITSIPASRWKVRCIGVKWKIPGKVLRRHITVVWPKHYRWTPNMLLMTAINCTVLMQEIFIHVRQYMIFSTFRIARTPGHTSRPSVWWMNLSPGTIWWSLRGSNGTGRKTIIKCSMVKKKRSGIWTMPICLRKPTGWLPIGWRWLADSVIHTIPNSGVPLHRK